MSTVRRSPAPALAVLLLLAASTARAQTAPGIPDEPRVRLRLGALWLDPSLSLTNAGLDTNVFNEAEADVPASDFNITATPRTDAWLRLGRTWLSGSVRQDLVWYETYASERSANGRYAIGWIAPLNRLSLNVSSGLTHARERPGFEIDSRVVRNERVVNGSAEVRVLSSTYLGVSGERRIIDFREDAFFRGTSLQDELNRRVQSTGATLRHKITPLTSIMVAAGKEEERFDFSPDRDSDSTRITATLSFDPFALISGSATVGFRNFEPLSSTIPGYEGTTFSMNLFYVAFGTTRLTVEALRDIQSSYESTQPYYLQSGFQLGIQQQVYGPIEAEGRFGRQSMAYQDRDGIAVPAPDRVDRVRVIGAGLGYRVSPDFKLGFNVDRQERNSPLASSTYDGFRYGLSMTYGL